MYCSEWGVSLYDLGFYNINIAPHPTCMQCDNFISDYVNQFYTINFSFLGGPNVILTMSGVGLKAGFAMTIL